jgi:steroid delta-isomerase-like uncharacterized protein
VLQTGLIKDLSKFYIQEVLNNKNVKLIDTIFGQDYVFHETNGKDSYHMKTKTLAPYLLYLFKAFPDLYYTIDNIIAEGNKVALSYTVTGTHRGEFFGVPASGNKVAYKEIVIYRVEKGKIIEGWGVADVFGLQQQLIKK